MGAPACATPEMCWALRAPSGKVPERGIYLPSAPGVELRMGYGENLLKSQVVLNNFVGRELAEWRQTALSHRFADIVENSK